MGYGPFVPCTRLVPYIQEFLDRPGNTMALLEARTGVPSRAIYDILRGRRATVRFDTADRLLLGLDRIEAWREELNDIYEVA